MTKQTTIARRNTHEKAWRLMSDLNRTRAVASMSYIVVRRSADLWLVVRLTSKET